MSSSLNGMSHLVQIKLLNDSIDNPSNVFAYTLLNLGIEDIETIVSTENIIRCGDPATCPDGNVAWNSDYDVSGIDRFYVSDNEQKFMRIASRILNREIENLINVKLGESWYLA